MANDKLLDEELFKKVYEPWKESELEDMILGPCKKHLEILEEEKTKKVECKNYILCKNTVESPGELYCKKCRLDHDLMMHGAAE